LPDWRNVVIWAISFTKYAQILGLMYSRTVLGQFSNIFWVKIIWRLFYKVVKYFMLMSPLFTYVWRWKEHNKST
jgi:hypothetical protein